MRRAGVEYSVAMALVGHTPLGETASYGIYLEDLKMVESYKTTLTTVVFYIPII